MKIFLDDSDCLILDHKEFRNFSIHPLWLRERVNNKQYLDQNNYQRLYEPSLLDVNIKFLKYDFEDNYLKVEFTVINLPIYDFNSLNDENYISKLLTDFQELGFVIVNNTSKDEGTVIKFAELFGPVRTTNFGKLFDVVSKPKANDLAYTSLGIKAHTDNPYRKPMPGIQILHCIANEAKGGDSSLVDGYAVAEYLKKNEPDMFKILTTTNVLFKFIDKDIILENWGKLIELDHNDEYLQSRFSGRLDYVPYLKPSQLKNFYEARKKLYHLYESEEFELNFRLESGMLMMFDNIRVLHGRTEYDVNTGFRHLQGCYIDHDSTEGKLRRLRSSL